MRLSLRFLVPLLLALGRVRLRRGAARRRADAALVRPRPRHPLEPDRLDRAGAAGGADRRPDRTPRIAAFFNRMLQDERLYAIGLCLTGRQTPIATRQLPPRDPLRGARRPTGGARPACCRSPRGPLHLAVRAVDRATRRDAQLVLVHDMSFVERRSEETRRYLFYFFVALGVVHRAHHRRHRAALVARLGAGAARAAARRGHPAAVAPRAPRPSCGPIARDLRRADPRPRAAVPAARRQPAHLGPGGAARDAAQRAARQRRDRRLQPRAVHPRARRRTASTCSGRPAASSPRWSR